MSTPPFSRSEATTLALTPREGGEGKLDVDARRAGRVTERPDPDFLTERDPDRAPTGRGGQTTVGG